MASGWSSTETPKMLLLLQSKVTKVVVIYLRDHELKSWQYAKAIQWLWVWQSKFVLALWVERMQLLSLLSVKATPGPDSLFLRVLICPVMLLEEQFEKMQRFRVSQRMHVLRPSCGDDVYLASKNDIWSVCIDCVEDLLVVVCTWQLFKVCTWRLGVNQPVTNKT